MDTDKPSVTDTVTGDFGLRREAKRHAALDQAGGSACLPKSAVAAVAPVFATLRPGRLPAQSKFLPSMRELPGFLSGFQNRWELPRDSGRRPAAAFHPAARLTRALVFSAAAVFLFSSVKLSAQSPFQFPTANHALYDRGSELNFFAPTAPEKPWTSGSFGCVRTDGRHMHEGIDIRCLQRDRHGEPTDPVLATADGTVVYFSHKPALSNFGKYIVIRHFIEGIEIYSLYAHLSQIQTGLAVGKSVRAGEVIGTMGRTSNTGETITRDRAHVHFELNLFVNEGFDGWYRQTYPKQRNDHSIWNGQNLDALDTREIFLAQHNPVNKFSLLNFIRGQTELCRVLVRSTNFHYLKRYPMLVLPNPVAQKEGVAGYEITLNYNGVAFALMPRAASEIPGNSRIQLLSANEEEEKANACRHLVVRRNGRWQLTDTGLREIELLIY
jgi:murein DD-endopeptidase MepM/ murein hydrolase activator NlpD